MYRKEKRDDIRARLYREIDNLSLEASLLAIPNEYDKLMDAIGSQGSNAGTSNDYTIFMENIPSNQLENWAKIQAERFSRPVLRLFHTELETVYEEKNMSLTSDSRKVNEVMMKASFPQPSLWDPDNAWRSGTPEKSFYEEYPGVLREILCPEQHGHLHVRRA